MVSGHNPLLMRPLFETKVEYATIKIFAEVDGVTESYLAFMAVSLGNVGS